MEAADISYHIDDIQLWDFAKGKLSAGESLVVKTHLEYCPECAAIALRYSNICGAMLAQTEGVDMSEAALEKALARLDTAEPENTQIIPKQRNLYGYDLPQSLQNVTIAARYFIGPGVWIAPVIERVKTNAAKCYLLFVKRGMDMLLHSHSGREITLVLHGKFHDGSKEYHTGDFIIEDENTTHAPGIFADEDCLSLVYQDGPIRAKHWLGHLLKPIAQI